MVRQKWLQQWVVPGNNDKEYKVSLYENDKYKCSCPHWIFRLQKTGEDCKHIIDVKDGFYDKQEIKLRIIHRGNVPFVTERKDGILLVRLIPFNKEASDILFTDMYDLAFLHGVAWRQVIEEYSQWFDHRLKKEDAETWVQNRGRYVYTDFVKGRGWTCPVFEAIT